ncbi:MAG: purine-nucleoside phosphorylase [Lachnospiraceae bacterium]|nr:purine-nucleoside phosphorylase [Lachnospiraceae bacterium]
MATPHNQGEKGQIAKTVIMPGDPLRAKFIAETYLSGAELFTQVRNVYGYTGRYRGEEVSVMASGMGMPSMGIYSYELFHVYDVDSIIRVGSAGSYCEKCKIFDTLLVTEAYSESSFAKVQNGYEKDTLYPSGELNDLIEQTAGKMGKSIILGPVHSTDVFYRDGDPDYYKKIFREKGCLAVEMESFALFHNAQACKKQAACLLTISDSFVSEETTTSEEREKSFADMIEIALETVKNIKK